MTSVLSLVAESYEALSSTKGWHTRGLAEKKEIRPRVATPSLNPRKFSRDSGARERDVVSQALYVRYAAGYRMKFYISTVLYDIANIARGQ